SSLAAHHTKTACHARVHSPSTEIRRDDFARLHPCAEPCGPANAVQNRSRRFCRETPQFSPRARERPWPVVHWRKSSRRFPRDPTHFAAGQGAALACGLLAEIVETISARPYTFRRGPGSGPGLWSIGGNRRDDFRETLHVSPRARERPWPVVYWRKSSRRFPRDPTHFAAGQGAALARYAVPV